MLNHGQSPPSRSALGTRLPDRHRGHTYSEAPTGDAAATVGTG